MGMGMGGRVLSLSTALLLIAGTCVRLDAEGWRVEPRDKMDEDSAALAAEIAALPVDDQMRAFRAAAASCAAKRLVVPAAMVKEWPELAQGKRESGLCRIANCPAAGEPKTPFVKFMSGYNFSAAQHSDAFDLYLRGGKFHSERDVLPGASQSTSLLKKVSGFDLMRIGTFDCPSPMAQDFGRFERAKAALDEARPKDDTLACEEDATYVLRHITRDGPDTLIAFKVLSYKHLINDEGGTATLGWRILKRFKAIDEDDREKWYHHGLLAKLRTFSDTQIYFTVREIRQGLLRALLSPATSLSEGRTDGAKVANLVPEGVLVQGVAVSSPQNDGRAYTFFNAMHTDTGAAIYARHVVASDHDAFELRPGITGSNTFGLLQKIDGVEFEKIMLESVSEKLQVLSAVRNVEFSGPVIAKVGDVYALRSIARTTEAYGEIRSDQVYAVKVLAVDRHTVTLGWRVVHTFVKPPGE
ncbi:MAG: hypothetical protein IT462_03525 [Planctomycetes bacterium]|nr:hypothetical protein [Planctomycetota bacterium]